MIDLDACDVIANIEIIYDRFEIPPNLRAHMFRVAAVAELICDNCVGEPINKDIVVAVALLHDLGNIVKFNFSPETSDILGDEAGRMSYWREAQKRVISKYGNDEDAAREKMARELGVENRISFLINQHDCFAIERASDFEAKIVAYSDLRVGPFGAVPLETRISDLLKRNPKRYPEGFLESSLRIEGQILQRVRISSTEINDQSIRPYMKKYAPVC